MSSTLGTPIPRKPVVTVWALAAVGLGVVSSWGAWQGRYPWTMPLVCLGLGVFLVLVPWLRSRGRETVQVDDRGVLRVEGQTREEVRWDEVTRVRIVTTSAGPFGEDVFFALDGKNGSGCLVSHEAAVRTKLLEEIQLKLKNVNDAEVIKAMGCTTDSSFVIWERAS